MEEKDMYDKLNKILNIETRNKELLEELSISSILSEIIIESSSFLKKDMLLCNNSVSLNKSLNEAISFFKSINLKYSNQVQNIIKNERTNNKPSVLFSKKHFIGNSPIDFSGVDSDGVVYIDYENTVNDIYSIVHEMTHKLSSQYDTNSRIKNILGEVTTITMELLLEYYLKKEKFDSNVEIEKRNINRLITTYKDAGCILFEKDLVDLYLKQGFINENILLNELNNTNKSSNKYELYSEEGYNYLKDIIENGNLLFRRRQRYVIGLLFALYVVNEIAYDNSNILVLDILIDILGKSDLSFDDDVKVLSDILPLLHGGKIDFNVDDINKLKMLYDSRVNARGNYRVF